MFKYLLISVISIIAVELNSQNLRFYVATDASVTDPLNKEYTVLQNSVFEVSFVLENGEGNAFTPPSFEGFQVVQGPSTSTQVSIVNGHRSEKRSYTYNLIGNVPGIYTIEGAAINTDKGQLKTENLKIIVTKAVISEGAKESNIMAVASDTNAYIGQQIIIRYELETQENIKSYDILSEFDFPGFFVRQLDDISRRPERIIKDGKEYFKTTLEAVSLFPQQTGTYTIPSITLRVGIPRASRRRSLFSFQEYDYKVLNTQPISIIVNDLPPNAPLSFAGAVGKYEATFEIDKRSLSTDQSLNLKLSIRGNGDSKYVIPPIMDLGEDFEVYEPNTLRDESYVTGEEVVNYKVFEYLLVPRRPGQYSLIPEFSYFNIDSNRYENISPEAPFKLNVTKGQNPSNDLSEILNRNLRPNKPSSVLTRGKWQFMGSGLHFTILGLIFLGWLGMASHQYLLRRESNMDPILKAKKRARKTAIKRLQLAQQYMESNDHREFYNEVSKSILHYLEDKLNISTGSLTMKNLVGILDKKGMDEKTLSEINTLLKQSELALFAGKASDDLSSFYHKAISIIEDIEASF